MKTSNPLSLGLLIASLTLAACRPVDRPPDVVLIELDGVRADHLGHLGYDLPTSRGLDALRDRGSLFADARSPSSSSEVGTAGLLTGVGPQRLRMGGADPRLDPSHPTLAESLKAAGWTTVGRSHHPGIRAESGFARGFDEFVAASGAPEDHPDTGEMVDWLREWLAVERPEPFFLYLHPMNAHAPYRVPAGHRGVLLGRPPLDALAFDGPLMRAARRGRKRALEAIGEREVRSLVEQYDTALRYDLDRVGQMLAMLDQAGRFEQALVVVTSNHGEELFDRGGFGHGRTLYEEVLRVPLYVKLPDQETARRFDAPVSTLDVMPTILDWLGLPAGEGGGRSLVPLLRDESEALPDRDFFYAVEPGGSLTRVIGLRRGRYKLIEGIGGPQLYDLALDPGERNDLARSSREIVMQLRAVLNEAFGVPGPPAS